MAIFVYLSKIIMKIWLAFILFSFLSTAHSEAQELCNANRINFQPGESLNYVVSYNWFVIWTEVGEVTFSLENAKIGEISCYHLLGLGQTYPGWDLFFKVRDRYESWVYPETLKPF